MAKAGKSRRAAVAVAMAQSIRVDGGQSTEIGTDQRVAVGGSQVVVIGKDRQAQIGGSDSVTIKVDDVIAVGGAFSLSVGKDATLDVGGGFTVSAARVRLRATQELRLEVGSSLIVLKPNGDIQIKGNRIDVLGSGEVHIKGAKVLTN
jgi:type VI secretion system secreted protein VgrG